MILPFGCHQISGLPGCSTACLMQSVSLRSGWMETQKPFSPLVAWCLDLSSLGVSRNLSKIWILGQTRHMYRFKMGDINRAELFQAPSLVPLAMSGGKCLDSGAWLWGKFLCVLYSEPGLTWNQYERGMHRAATNVLTKTGCFPSAETRCQLPPLELSKGGSKWKLQWQLWDDYLFF